LTKQVLATLAKVNAFANAEIEPISNLDHWGTTLDHWDYSTDGKGDCKVYALFKREQLVDQGFPRAASLMTIVRDQNGEGHAVPTVKTDRGDFVLDNLTDEILPRNETGCRFIKRQAQDDPNVWLAMTCAATSVASGGLTGFSPFQSRLRPSRIMSVVLRAGAADDAPCVAGRCNSGAGGVRCVSAASGYGNR
jgi:hypothetical protein